MTDIQKIYHSTLYVDGDVDMLGKFAEVKVPDLTATVNEHRGGGMFAPVELVSGLEKLVLSVKWNTYFPEAVKFGANPFKARRLQIRGNHETHNADGLAAQVPVVITVQGSWKKAGGFTFKPGEHGDTDDEVACTYLRVEVDGVELYEIDVLNNIYKVGGDDLLATMRQNLGGS